MNKTRDNVVTIPLGRWIVGDEAIPSLDYMVIWGTLELDHDLQFDVELNVKYLFIQGGRLIIGWNDKPFLGHAQIVLRGSHATPEWPTSYGAPVGAKVLGNSQTVTK